MQDVPEHDAQLQDDKQPSRGPSRRGFLGGLAVLGASAGLAACNRSDGPTPDAAGT